MAGAGGGGIAMKQRTICQHRVILPPAHDMKDGEVRPGG